MTLATDLAQARAMLDLGLLEPSEYAVLRYRLETGTSLAALLPLRCELAHCARFGCWTADLVCRSCGARTAVHSPAEVSDPVADPGRVLVHRRGTRRKPRRYAVLAMGGVALLTALHYGAGAWSGAAGSAPAQDRDYTAGYRVGHDLSRLTGRAYRCVGAGLLVQKTATLRSPEAIRGCKAAAAEFAAGR